VNEQTPEQKRRLPTIAIVGIIMAVIAGISLYIRIALPYHQVFVNGQVWFLETDSSWYMRNIEVIVRHFPHFNSFDPYMLFPGGGTALTRPFFAWLVSGVILLVRGATTLYHMEVIAAYIPPILGTLTLIPVYFIGKELFNRWVGVISAALVAILPSEFLHRSLLGFLDHHVAEVLFSSVCVLFLIMAIKRAREREISFDHILSRDWSTVRKPLIYTLLAGIFLGIYLLTWVGGLMFIFIIFAYLVIQFIVDHLRRKSTDYLCIVGTPLFLIAFLMLLPILANTSLDTLSRVSLTIGIVVPIVLSIISRLMAGRALKPVYYLLTLLALTGIGLAALHAINPSLLRNMLHEFSVFTPSGASLSVMEVQPLLFAGGTFTLSIAWVSFTASFFIAFISLGMLIYTAVKGKGADKILFLVWSIVMLIAVLGQRRFGYYYAINAALLTGYFSWKMLDLAGLRKLLAKPKEVVAAVKKFKKREKKTRVKAKPRTFMQPRGAWARVIVVGIVIFFAVFFPNISIDKAVAESSNYVMNNGWYSSLLWLKDNSPEPFGAPSFYYELYPPKSEFVYPASAYSVMSWWDYGYFIMQIAHRIPNANPTQSGAVQAGQFFTAQNESAANAIADKEGTKYVMIDYLMATSKFYAMAEWAGESVGEFFGVYYAPISSSALQPVALYYPAYYNSTVARLYNFDGKAVVPSTNSTIAISWQLKTGNELLNGGYTTIGSGGTATPVNAGASYYVIVGYRLFSSYKQAEDHVSTQQSGNYDIGGLNPFVTIVPLEALNSYQLIYPSSPTITTTTVKIFEYLGSGGS
jgi:oligosaccharyl transferase (archaeosortase A-associated)